MDQKSLIVAAMKQGGLTSFYQLAQRLGVPDSRVSQLRHGQRAADEAEISMLAEMAGIDVRVALAAVHKDREKNPAKRAYWEKIAAQFALAMLMVTLGLTGLTSEVHASEKGFSRTYLSTNYAKFYTAFMGWLKHFLRAIIDPLSLYKGQVNNG
jgi:transcriptional regulator with XRE-family HTH domain